MLTGPLPRCSHGQHWARQKPVVSSGSPIPVQGPRHLSHTLLLSQALSSQLGQKWSSRDSNQLSYGVPATQAPTAHFFIQRPFLSRLGLGTPVFLSLPPRGTLSLETEGTGEGVREGKHSVGHSVPPDRLSPGRAWPPCPRPSQRHGRGRETPAAPMGRLSRLPSPGPRTLWGPWHSRPGARQEMPGIWKTGLASGERG